MPIRKIVIAGPKGSGKSMIANFLSGHSGEILPVPDLGKYAPTAGVRIIEFETTLRSGTENIEIWDASGDHSLENCWAAIMSEADGVLLVYNPDAAGQVVVLSSLTLIDPFIGNF